MDVVVFPIGERVGGWGEDWQQEFHVIPFGMEGTLPGKSLAGVERETSAGTAGQK